MSVSQYSVPSQFPGFLVLDPPSPLSFKFLPRALVSFLVSSQTNLLLWDLSYCWHHHYGLLSLPFNILVIYWVGQKKKIIWTSGYYGKTGMKFLVNPILSIFYISWVFLNPVFILPPLILFFFWYVCGIATIIPIFKKRRVKLRQIVLSTQI